MSLSDMKSEFDLIGGEKTIIKLVEAFYPRVYSDPDLSPLFPHGVEEIMRKQKMFLTQFLGGPPLFSQEFGPPAMRARHLRFEITPRQAKAWLKCMEEAMKEIGLEGTQKDRFFISLTNVAHLMVNTPDTE